MSKQTLTELIILNLADIIYTKDKPEKVGVAYIIIESLDDVDEKGYHIAKSIYYE